MPLNPFAALKTAFISALGLYQYSRMPFGNKNAPQMFMLRINEIITMRKFRERVKSFMEDITMQGATWQ